MKVCLSAWADEASLSLAVLMAWFIPLKSLASMNPSLCSCPRTCAARGGLGFSKNSRAKAWGYKQCHAKISNLFWVSVKEPAFLFKPEWLVTLEEGPEPSWAAGSQLSLGPTCYLTLFWCSGYRLVPWTLILFYFSDSDCATYKKLVNCMPLLFWEKAQFLKRPSVLFLMLWHPYGGSYFVYFWQLLGLPAHWGLWGHRWELPLCPGVSIRNS